MVSGSGVRGSGRELDKWSGTGVGSCDGSRGFFFSWGPHSPRQHNRKHNEFQKVVEKRSAWFSGEALTEEPAVLEPKEKGWAGVS